LSQTSTPCTRNLPTFDVVVLNKDELIGEFLVAHHLGDLLQDFFAWLVVGMSLAGKEELHRAFGSFDHGHQALNVGQNQGSPALKWANRRAQSDR